MRSLLYAFCLIPLFAFSSNDIGPWTEWDKGSEFPRNIEQPQSYFAYYLEKLHELNALIEISDGHLSLTEIEFVQDNVSRIFDKLAVLEQLQKERIYALADEEDYEEIVLQAALWKKMKKKYRGLAQEWGSKLDAYKDAKIHDLKEKAYESSTDLIRRLLELEEEAR